MTARQLSANMLNRKVNELLKKHLVGKGFLDDLGHLFGFGYDEMHGGSFFSDFADGFKKGFGAVISPASKILSILPIPEFQTAGKILDVGNSAIQGLGYDDLDDDEEDGGAYGLYIKKNRKNKTKRGAGLDRQLGCGIAKKGRPKVKKQREFDPNSKTARRASMVRKVMDAKRLTMIQASKYIKDHNIAY